MAKFLARIRPRSRSSDEIDSVHLELLNADGSPAELGSGDGGVSSYIEGDNIQTGVAGTIWAAYFDGSDPAIDVVGFDVTGDQAIKLPPGIYTSTWQWGFDTTADDGPEDTMRGFTVQIQPLGKALEDYPQKPEGGWADFNPYSRALGYNFIVPNENNDLMVMLNASTSDETNVQFYLNFLLIRLGDIPVEEG